MGPGEWELWLFFHLFVQREFMYDWREKRSGNIIKHAKLIGYKVFNNIKKERIRFNEDHLWSYLNRTCFAVRPNISFTVSSGGDFPSVFIRSLSPSLFSSHFNCICSSIFIRQTKCKHKPTTSIEREIAEEVNEI